MTELEKSYDHSKVEQKIYKLWEDSGFFNPDKLPGDRKQPYTIIMPPPNANAPSHVGHALGYTIQDILIRYNRMQGKKTLWLPGSDHAGFETQVVFEKKLEKEGRSRFKMQREEFYKEIWDYVQTNKHISEQAIKRLGASCDWSRNIFTLDPEIIKVVYQTFKRMSDDGLIYRGLRLGNWCFKHQTALSDLETKYEERTEPFYYFKYGPFTIGTSRPETKFGDKYVVMHPDDKRYLKYKDGDTFTAEWINGPIKATIIKDEAVDMEFGSGVMTITPWHDAVDFDLAQKHNLEKEQIIDKYGKLLPIAGEFAGMKITVARPLVVEKLKAKGLLEKVEENYKHNVQVCYKCNTVIEPQILPQWFVAMTKALPDGRPSLRDMAVNAIKNGEVKIVTEKFEKIFLHWMDNIRDWPISRQIWWGIPIPAWYHLTCGVHGKQTEPFISIEQPKTCPNCGTNFEGIPLAGRLEQDPETFDTWFSSGQWPYATMMANDAKHGTKTFENFYPTQVMETAWDILFFWVARMTMFSYYRTGKPPFEKVFLHGLVRDKDRQKMSKSKGNVVDPLAVIDTYGCDALRFALIFSTSAGNDIPLAEDKIKGMKHFANKLWNIARYVLANIDNAPVAEGFKPSPTTDADREILAKLDAAIKSAANHLDNFRLHEAAQEIYQFTWHELADIYVEASKKQLLDEKLKENTQKLLLHNLINVLKLLHPFMPFITEELWGILGQAGLLGERKLLIISDWPK